MNIEELLREKLGKEILEREIQGKIKSFNGLLTREAAISMLAKESNLVKDEENHITIDKITPGMRRVNFTAKVKKIYPETRYISGKRSRSIKVDDGTGEILIKCWEADIEKIKSIGLGDTISIKGANERRGELNIGYNGSVEVIQRADITKLSQLPEQQDVNVQGKIDKIKGIIPSFNQEIFSFTITNEDGENETECRMWERKRRGSRLEEGDEIRIQNAFVKNGKLEILEKTRMMVRKNKNVIHGMLHDIKAVDDSLELTIDSQVITVNRKQALSLFGIYVRDDISLDSIVTLKKNVMLNKYVTIQKDD